MDLTGGLQPIEQRHSEVEHCHVGTKVSGEKDGLLSIGGIPDDVEVFPLEEGLQPLAKDLMVVSQDDAERHVSLLAVNFVT
jgi:hypothetical protein